MPSNSRFISLNSLVDFCFKYLIKSLNWYSISKFVSFPFICRANGASLSRAFAILPNHLFETPNALNLLARIILPGKRKERIKVFTLLFHFNTVWRLFTEERGTCLASTVLGANVPCKCANQCVCVMIFLFFFRFQDGGLMAA